MERLNFNIYSWNNRDVIQVMDWIQKIFIDEDLIEYFFKYCSSHLLGNENRIIPIFLGDGSNSKSLLSKLIKYYYELINHQYNRRIWIIDSSDEFTIDKILNDYHNWKLFDPSGFHQNQMLIISNSTIPDLIKNCGIRDQIRIVPFQSKWVDNPPDNINHQFRERQFKKDPKYNNRVMDFISPFQWIVNQYYPIYLAEGLLEPESITRIV